MLGSTSDVPISVFALQVQSYISLSSFKFQYSLSSLKFQLRISL